MATKKTSKSSSGSASKPQAKRKTIKKATGSASESKVIPLRRKRKSKHMNEITAIITIAVGILLGIGLYTDGGGFIGKAVDSLFNGLFGFGAMLVPIVIVSFAIISLLKKELPLASKSYIFGGLFLCVISFAHVLYTKDQLVYNSFSEYVAASFTSGEIANGGLFGALIGDFFLKILGSVGTYILFIALALVLIILLTDKSVFEFLKNAFDKGRDFIDERKELAAEKREEAEYEYEEEEIEVAPIKEQRPIKKQERKAEDGLTAASLAAEIRKERDYENKKKSSVVTISSDSNTKATKNKILILNEGKARRSPHLENYNKEPAKLIKLEPRVRQEAEVQFPEHGELTPIIHVPEPNIVIKGVEINDDFFANQEEIHEVMHVEENTESSPEPSIETLMPLEVEIEPEVIAKCDELEELEYETYEEHDDTQEEFFIETTKKVEVTRKDDIERMDHVRVDYSENIEKTEMERLKQKLLDEKLEAENARIKEREEQIAVQNSGIKQVIRAPYQFPPVELLTKNPVVMSADTKAEILENSRKLEETLKTFKVDAKVMEVSKGPTITRYELLPGQGVKLNTITNLSNDLALNLAVATIRIEPIPGKQAVGIEVPNKVVTPVYFREVIDSQQYKDFSSKLAFGLGKDIAGNTVVADIAEMPHLLIAGSTGSGKSVCINTLINSIIFKADPSEVKLVMVDPKVVELSIYNGIPHLLIPVVTDPKKASGALNWAVQEMETRYGLFSDCAVRNLQGYNQHLKEKGEEKLLPQIVIIIDELADLMMTAPGEVETAICRLAQKARAAGIHLVVATQRPSVDVITGLIKANIPSRIAFSVSSGIDSRTILDSVGAEKLLGKGDMFFLPKGMGKPQRIQGAFISDKEVEHIVDFVKQNATPIYDESIIEKITSSKGSSSNSGTEVDELFAEAAQLVIDKDKASASMLQRQFRVGYNRAARLIEELENHGVVGPEDGSKPRKILMTQSEWEEYKETVL